MRATQIAFVERYGSCCGRAWVCLYSYLQQINSQCRTLKGLRMQLPDLLAWAFDVWNRRAVEAECRVRAKVIVRPQDETVVMAQKVALKDADRCFDVAFWQAQDTTARFNAAWELVEHYLRREGRENELRLQRSVATLQRIRG